MPMTPTHELRRLLGEATPGPWKCVGPGMIQARREEPVHDTLYVTLAECMNMSLGDPLPDVSNGDLIVAAVNALPALLDRVDALEGALREIKALKSTPIGNTGFVVGPALLLRRAQEIAREATSTSKRSATRRARAALAEDATQHAAEAGEEQR